MKITFLGSGNVATHLALALHNCGCEISQVWSRNYSHAQLLAGRVNARPTDQLNAVDHASDVYILATSDDALFDLALDLNLDPALVLHTSGATSMEVLKPISRRYGVLWSPQTFVRDVALEYSTLPFCIEGCDAKTEHDIELLVSKVSGHIYHTNREQRQCLHISAVFVNNFTNALFGVAQDICQQHHIPFETLYTLIDTTAQRVKWGDVRFQMTGPAVRHDNKTLDSHRRLLAANPEYLELYNSLTQLIQDKFRF